MPSAANDDARPVWVSGLGRLRYCRACGQPEGQCQCASKRARSGGTAAQLPRDGIVRLLRDRSGRKGKLVTLLVGLPDDPVLLRELASSLKKQCGTGGTVRGDVIEMQGDVRELLRAKLEALGYRTKIAGG